MLKHRTSTARRFTVNLMHVISAFIFIGYSAHASEIVQDSAARQETICKASASSSSDETANDRLPPIPYAAMSDEQRAAAASIASGPRGCLFGPFSVLHRSPELLERTQQLGAYLRFRSTVPYELRELAILIAGKYWNSPYVWYVHEPIARSTGVSRAIADAISSGKRPDGMSDEEQAVYDSVDQLLNTKMIDDQNYKRLVDKIGERGVVELTATVGYFTLLAMSLNVARTPVPSDYPAPFASAEASVRASGRH